MAITRYVESGYVEAGYVEVIVDENIGTLTANAGDLVSASFSLSCDAIEFIADERYVEEGYVEAGYVEVTKFLQPLTLISSVDLNANLTEVTAIEASASISSAFSLNSTIGTLEDADASFSIAFSQSVLGDLLPSGSASLASAFSTNIDIEKILDADATLDATASITANGDRTVDASANFGGLFSPNIIVGVIKVIDATLDASADLSATISKFTGNEATLSNIVNLSLQGAKTAGYNASFSSAFSQTSATNFTASADATLTSQINFTAQVGQLFDPAFSNETDELLSQFSVSITPRVLVRNTSITNTDTSQDLIYFDSSKKKFGTHSLHVGYHSDSQPVPRSRIIYNGTNFYVFDNGSTWSSSNGTTWTRSSNNLSALTASNENHIDYLNNQFVLRKSEKLYFSSNGTSWTETNLGSYSNYILSVDQWVAWDGTYWYIPIRVGSFAGQIRMLRTTDLTEPLYDFDVYFFSTPSSGYGGIFWTGVTHNGSTPAFSYEQESTFNNGYTYQKRLIIVGALSSSYLIGTDVYRANQSSNPLNYINSKYTLISQDGSNNQGWKIYTSSNGSSWSSSTYSSDAAEWVDYDNGYYIVGTNQKILTGTTISNITNRSVPKLVNSNAQYSYPGAGDGSTYILNTRSSGQVIETTNYTSFTAQDPLPSSELLPYVSISRGDNSDFDSWKTVDFWVYVTNVYNTLIIVQRRDLSGTNDIYNWRIACQDDDLLISDGTNSYTSSVAFTRNQWNHVRIIQDSSSVSAWVNGSKGISQQTISIGSSSYPIVIESITQTTDFKQIDELLISDSLLSSHSDTTISVPTAAWENATNTDLLLHFDNDFTDDSRFSSTVDPEADITAVSTFTASFGGLFNVSADISSQASITADVDATKGADATLSSNVSLTATALRIQEGNSTANSNLSVSANVNKITDVNSTSNLAFTTTFDVNVIRDAECDFDSIATQLSAASKIGDFLVAFDSNFATTATANITTDIDDTLSSAFELNASETTLFKAFDAALTQESFVVVVAVKTTDTNSTQSSAFTQTGSGDRIRFGVSTITSNANLVVETAPLRDAEADLISSFTQPLTTTLTIKQLESASSSTFTQVTDAIKAVNAAGNLVSQFTQTTDVNRTRDFGCDFDSVATQVSAVAKIGDFLIDADVVTSLTATARKTTGNVIANDIEFTLTADFGIIKQGASIQSSAMSLVGSGTTNIVGEADLDSEINVSATAIKAVEAQASFGGAGGFAITAVATRNNEIQTSTTATMVVDAVRFRLATSSMDSAISTVISAGKRVESASSINTTISVVADVRIIVTDAIVYNIPAETREFTVVAETREYTIVEETREYTIKGAE